MTDEKNGTTVWDHDAAGGDETEIVNPVLDYDQHRETEVAPTACLITRRTILRRRHPRRTHQRESFLVRALTHGDGSA